CRSGFGGPTRSVRRRDPGVVRADGRHGDRRTRRGRGETRPDVLAIRSRHARYVPGGDACVRSARPAESGQGRAHLASLCRIRADARARRKPAISRAATILMDSALNQLCDTVRAASASRTPLCIRAGGTKDFYGNPPQGTLLDPRSVAGIVEYEPTELVVTARGGTSLAELEQL